MSADHGGFTYKDREYFYGGNATLGELAWCERRLGVDRGTFSPHEIIMVAYWVTLTRAHPERRKDDVWQEIYNANHDAFTDTEDENEPEEPELPKDQWPLDPTVAGTATAAPSESGQNVPPDPRV